jgi:hypothetical protein
MSERIGLLDDNPLKILLKISISKLDVIQFVKQSRKQAWDIELNARGLICQLNRNNYV